MVSRVAVLEFRVLGTKDPERRVMILVISAQNSILPARTLLP